VRRIRLVISENSTTERSGPASTTHHYPPGMSMGVHASVENFRSRSKWSREKWVTCLVQENLRGQNEGAETEF